MIGRIFYCQNYNWITQTTGTGSRLFLTALAKRLDHRNGFQTFLMGLDKGKALAIVIFTKVFSLTTVTYGTGGCLDIMILECFLSTFQLPRIV